MMFPTKILYNFLSPPAKLQVHDFTTVTTVSDLNITTFLVM